MHVITSDAVVIGVDTHKDVHVAVAINGLGARLATASFPVTSKGYRQMAAWAAKHGTVHAFGIEGTGSYGAGLTRALTAMGLRVIEVGRVNRQLLSSVVQFSAKVGFENSLVGGPFISFCRG